MFFFFGDAGGGAVAGENGGIGGEGEEVGADAVGKDFETAAGEVCAANAAGEEYIAGDDPVALGIIK